MPSKRDEVDRIEEGCQRHPGSATASRTEVALINDRAKAPDQPFRLMDLPIELRTMVFKQFLIMPGPILFRCTSSKQLAPFVSLDPVEFDPIHCWASDSVKRLEECRKIRQSSLLNIFLASKMVYRETAPLYFRCNQFHFQTLDCMEDFISRVGAESRWQVASITVGYSGRAPVKAIKRLNKCLGLRELTLNMDCFSVIPFNHKNQDEVALPGMRDLLRIRGLGQIRIWMDRHCFILPNPPPFEYIIDSLEKQLQVLTEPRDPKQLKRQERKDFPNEAKRTVFGAANVVTRSAKKMQNIQH